MFGKENVGLYRGGFGKGNIGLSRENEKKASQVFRTIWIKIHRRGKLTRGINVVAYTNPVTIRYTVHRQAYVAS